MLAETRFFGAVYHLAVNDNKHNRFSAIVSAIVYVLMVACGDKIRSLANIAQNLCNGWDSMFHREG